MVRGFRFWCDLQARGGQIADATTGISAKTREVLLRADAIVADTAEFQSGDLLRVVESNCVNLALSVEASAKLAMAAAAAWLDSGERHLLSQCAADLM